jgi:hypothetical protein
MALIQALISLLTRSSGKILNAIFGWAVVALFGRTSPKEQYLLSGLVGLAAAWPFLLAGIAFPRVTAFVVAFVPLSNRVSDTTVRLTWAGLALLVPILVGVVIGAKDVPGSPREPFLKRVLRGFPITLGIAGAFALMFLIVPLLRVLSAARSRSDEHVPCITEAGEYEAVAADIERIFQQHGVAAQRTDPPWWLAAPSRLLQLAGRSLRGFMPEQLAYWQGAELEVAFYPSDILVRGKRTRAAWSHGVLAEALAQGPGLQTFDPDAQALERQLRRIWRVYRENVPAHTQSRALLSRVTDIAEGLSVAPIEYDDWQVLYRQIAQLDRALRGVPQLLESNASLLEAPMESEVRRATSGAPKFEAVSTSDLVAEFARQSKELVKKQFELAQNELRRDWNREIRVIKGFGLAAICALATLNLLLVAAVLGLAEQMAGWAAALIVAAVVFVIGGAFGWAAWARRVRTPLEKTLKTVKEDVQWAKERLA